jgi:hypothetical protein
LEGASSPRELFVSWFGLNSGRSFTLSSLELLCVGYIIDFFGFSLVPRNNKPIHSENYATLDPHSM